MCGRVQARRTGLAIQPFICELLERGRNEAGQLAYRLALSSCRLVPASNVSLNSITPARYALTARLRMCSRSELILPWIRRNRIVLDVLFVILPKLVEV